MPTTRTVYQPTLTGHRGYLGAHAPEGCRWEPWNRKLKTGAHGEHRLVDEDGTPVVFDTAEEAEAAALAQRWPTSTSAAGSVGVALTPEIALANYDRWREAGHGGPGVPTPHRAYAG